MQIRLTTDPSSRKTSGKSDRKKAESTRDTAFAPAKTAFESILDEVLPPESDPTTDLHELWSQLPETENRLIDSPSDKNLKDYRELIRSIIGETLKRNTRVKKILRKSRMGGEVELNVVDFVDSRLQQMIHAIRSPGNSAFQILKNIEEIRGILLDIKADG